MRVLARLFVVAVVVGALAVGGFLIVERGAEEPAVVTEAAATEVVEVVRTDLVDTETFAGTLRYREPQTIRAAGPGVVTALTEEGALVRRGRPLAEIDGSPVSLLYGDRPAWRTLSTATRDGPDVLQLEENLVALGLDPDGELTVDDDFTSLTGRIVEDWQEELGIAETGRIELGRVVFLPGPARVGAHQVELGATVAPGTPLLVVTGPDQEVVIDLPADRQDLATVGDEVTVELPAGEAAKGRVVEIGALARTPPGATEPVIDVVIALDDPDVAGDLNEAPVDVELVAGRAEDVLAVPVQALLALAEGGYALEIAGDGPTRLVPVEIGEFADGLVEVRGDVTAGTPVVVPR